MRSGRMECRALAAAGAALWTSGAPLAAEPAAAIKLSVAQAGIYEVTGEQLAAAGLPAGLAAARLRADRHGQALPVAIEAGADGRIDAGDLVRFAAPRLAGDRSYYHEHARHDVVWLRWDEAAAPSSPPASPVALSAATPPLWSLVHREVDRLRLRFAATDERGPEPWYWTRLSYLDPPFVESLALPGFCADCPEAVSLRVELKGWSTQTARGASRATPRPPDHQVDLQLDGEAVTSREWQGQDVALVEVPRVPVHLLADGQLDLTLSTPRRRPGPGAPPIVDVSVVNWIELRYPRRPWVDTDPVRFETTPLAVPAAVAIASPPGQELLAFAASGAPLALLDSRRDGARRQHRFLLPAGEPAFTVAPRDGVLHPAAIEPHVPAGLRHSAAAVDYLMIVHSTLRQAIEPLAEAHRRRGLAVRVIGVEEVYDEFSAGVVEPGAIRAFLEQARAAWPAPAPRFVLLVGDASWDPEPGRTDSVYASRTYRPQQLRRFPEVEHFAYPDPPRQRDLIPTGAYASPEGEIATDNWFVRLEPPSHLPVMAIGRLPVASAEEVEAIVEKTVRYLESAEVGPWRRNLLWVTNQDAVFQREADELADSFVGTGFHSRKLYPAPEVTAENHDQRALRAALDEGQLVVHFSGHGGRFIWRTGPPDLANNRDLFTLDDIDQLAPSGRLPFVVSITCYSAPFDHPTADSIGEKFLRVADRGAIAVLAASWRSSPDPRFARALLDALDEEPTIGEAVLAAKRRAASDRHIELYNLLGDPAVPLARPPRTVTLEAWDFEPHTGPDGERVSEVSFVQGEVPDELAGARALLEWVASDGQVLAAEEFLLQGWRFARPVPSELAVAAHIYVWDAARRRDAMGGVMLRLRNAFPAANAGG